MSKSYLEQRGTRKENIVIDSERILSELAKGNFSLSTNANTYSAEKYTTTYIGKIFSAIDSLQSSWNSCYTQVNRFINNFENYPEPDDIPNCSGLFNETVVSSNLGLATIRATSLNVRSGPGTNYAVVGSIKSGDQLKIKGYEGDWIKVETDDGSEAYISRNSKYVEVKSPANSKNDTKSSESIIKPNEDLIHEIDEGTKTSIVLGNVRTRGGNLNIRSEDASIIGKLKNNSEINIVGKTEDGNWYKIQLSDGKYGYVSASYIETNDDAIQIDTGISSQMPLRAVYQTKVSNPVTHGFVNTKKNES